jgi:hypothetical protein
MSKLEKFNLFQFISFVLVYLALPYNHVSDVVIKKRIIMKSSCPGNIQG